MSSQTDIYERLVLQRSSFIIIAFTLLFAFTLSTPARICHATTSSNLEYKLKAAFIYNFIKFTKWPKTTHQESNNNPLIVCIAGKNPFGTALEPLAQKKVSGRQIIISRATISDDMQKPCTCQVLFLATAPATDNFIEAVKHLGILTISDEVGFAQQGGCIELRKQKGKIRFIINRSAIKQQGLILGYQVYDLALEVIDEHQD
jgi:hypothetical protein